MPDKLDQLFALLTEVAKLAASGDIEQAEQTFLQLDIELQLLFTTGNYQHYTKAEIEYFASAMQQVLFGLIQKQKEIKNEVAAFSQLGSNKVSRRYLAK